MYLLEVWLLDNQMSEKEQFEKIRIPLPSLSVQKEIVKQIEAEQEIINANKKLIQIYEQKIKDKRGLGRVRGKDYEKCRKQNFQDY